MAELGWARPFHPKATNMTEQLALPEDFKGKDLLPALSGSTQLVPAGDIVGYDNVEPEDLVLPVIKCLQGMSPEVMQEAHPDARPGRFFLTSTREAFAGPLRVLVVHHHRSRALFPDSKNPRTASLKVCLSSDALKGTVYGYCSDCEYAEWGEDRSPPPCSLSHNFVIATANGPALLRFNRTSFKAGKEFASSCMLSVPRKNLWYHPAELRSVVATTKLPNGQEATYYRMSINWMRDVVTPEPMQQEARKLFEQVQAAFSAGKLGSDELDDDRPSTTRKPAQKKDEFEDKIPF